jgi:hypothetical protein
MKETSQQYVARILGNLEDEDPLEVLRSTPSRIKKAVRGMKRQTLYTRPAPGTWSVAEIVAHLAETEIVLAWRYRSIVEKNGVTLQPFEQDAWVKNSRYGKSDINEMLDMFTVLRKANIAFLSGLSPAQWKRYGMHQERGRETISHIVRLEAGHDINHVKQILKILGQR